MAKLNEEVVVIKISTLVPDSQHAETVMTSENIAALHQVVEQLVGNSRTLIEIEAAQ